MSNIGAGYNVPGGGDCRCDEFWVEHTRFGQNQIIGPPPFFTNLGMEINLEDPQFATAFYQYAMFQIPYGWSTASFTLRYAPQTAFDATFTVQAGSLNPPTDINDTGIPPVWYSNTLAVVDTVVPLMGGTPGLLRDALLCDIPVTAGDFFGIIWTLENINDGQGDRDLSTIGLHVQKTS